MLFLILALIFLYKFSTSNGTVNNAVGFVSCKFGTIYFSPWHTAIDVPVAIGNKNPIVDSYVWCNGKIDISLSSGVNFTYAETALIFSAKFLLHIITPFEFDVVPEVNISTLNSSGSICISSKVLSPESISSFPCFIIASNPTSLPFKDSLEFIWIKYFTSGKLSSIFFITSFFLVEYITAEALDLLITFSISFSGNSLSTGTAIPTPQSIAIYDTYQWYVFSPIIIILLSFKLYFSTSPVPNEFTSSPNFLNVISVKASFGLNFSKIKGKSAYSFIERKNTSFIVL